jgi:diadenosine tetraphosphate (Ap4A) HIT family hydrolase
VRSETLSWLDVRRDMVRDMTTTACYPCEREAEFDQLPPRERIGYDERWRVVHATGSGLLGWLVLVPRRHVMELADLTDDEAGALGIWQVKLARALSEELGVTKTYIAEFGEAAGFHLHFHVVARPLDLDVTMRGPGIFGFLGRTGEQAIGAQEGDDLAERLAARLAV